MSEKRNRQQLSPSSPNSEAISKKQHCTIMATQAADFTIKQLFDSLSLKIDGLDAKLDNKIQNLATKEDLLHYADDVQVIKESNEAIKSTLEELKMDREMYRKKFEHLDQASRAKNIIIKGITSGTNIYTTVNDLFAKKNEYTNGNGNRYYKGTQQ